MYTLKYDFKKKIVVKSEEERLVYGEVYVPYHLDSDEEAMTADEIKKMAHNFLKSGNINKIDINHNYEESGCVVVESFLVRGDNDPDNFVKGAWVIGANIIPDEHWEGVKKGDFNGFSFGGEAFAVPTKAIVNVAKRAAGETEESLNTNLVPIHSHEIALILDEQGRVLSGVVNEAFGHTHSINKISSTEKFLDHNHRVVLVNSNG